MAQPSQLRAQEHKLFAAPQNSSICRRVNGVGLYIRSVRSSQQFELPAPGVVQVSGSSQLRWYVLYHEIGCIADILFRYVHTAATYLNSRRG